MTAKFVRISKEFDFDAAHRLPNVPEGHKCGRMHGHTYRVELVFGGVVNEHSGMLFDYADIAAAWEPIGKTLDHYVLNEIPGLENPTTEVLAHWIMEKFKANNDRGAGGDLWRALRRVRVYESSTTWCDVEPAFRAPK